MSAPDAVFPFELPEAFNLCAYFLDRNLDEGRGGKVAVRVGNESRTYGQNVAKLSVMVAINASQ